MNIDAKYNRGDIVIYEGKKVVIEDVCGDSNQYGITWYKSCGKMKDRAWISEKLFEFVSNDGIKWLKEQRNAFRKRDSEITFSAIMETPDIISGQDKKFIFRRISDYFFHEIVIPATNHRMRGEDQLDLSYLFSRLLLKSINIGVHEDFLKYIENNINGMSIFTLSHSDNKLYGEFLLSIKENNKNNEKYNNYCDLLDLKKEVSTKIEAIENGG